MTTNRSQDATARRYSRAWSAIEPVIGVFRLGKMLTHAEQAAEIVRLLQRAVTLLDDAGMVLPAARVMQALEHLDSVHTPDTALGAGLSGRIDANFVAMPVAV